MIVRETCAKNYLSKLGYSVNTKAQAIIEACDNWYANREIDEFHKRKNLNDKEYELSRMNFAKRCCADDANLCEIISVAPAKSEKSQKFVEDLLKNNGFNVQYREQLEKTAALGMVGAYIYLQDATFVERSGEVSVTGGKIRINYVDAENIIPLTVINGEVTECAFCATDKVRGKNKTTLVIFLREKEKYKAITVVFNEYGEVVESEGAELQLSDIKPFAIMKNAEVNNLDDMKGYGLPKIYNSIPMFKAVDLCYNLLYGDLDKGQKLVFINELLACIQKDKYGKPYLTPQQKEIFILLGADGGKLPDEKTLIHEYNPEIRVEAITKAFELVLSLLSMSFGYGTKKYTFENGQIKTATEYIGERQDAMQELNKQRAQAVSYITDIVHAAEWFSNQFHGTTYDLEEDISIEFDDSFIEDRAAKLEAMRADALSFPEIPWLKFMYIKTKYNLNDEEAKKHIDEGITYEDADDTTD